MSKHNQRTYEEKLEIVQEILKGRTYTSVSEEYGLLKGTIANWKKKHLEGTLHLDRRGRKAEDIEDIEIIKKSYALLMKIRRTQHK